MEGMRAGEGRFGGGYGFGGRSLTAWHNGGGLTYVILGADVRPFVVLDAVDHLVFDHFLTGRAEHDVHVTGGAFVRF